jgi:flagellar basal-body rod protein FlgC
MPVDKIFGALNISANGLSAQRKKLDAISSNIANVETTRTEEGGPYRRKIVILESKTANGFESVLRKKTSKLTTTNVKHMGGSNKIQRSNNQKISVKTNEEQDNAEFKVVYDPNHPDANEEGYVYFPNVNLVSEMVDMITASRGYEANLSAIDAAKKMAKAALDI